MTNQRRYDVVVVGAGIVGLGHAYHALNRGLSVAVVDHADRVAGASIQNFGHVCLTAQSGIAREYARTGREHWLDLSRKAGFWSSESGTYCVARHDDELAVLTEFAEERGPSEVELLSRDRILAALPIAGDRVVGGMYMTDDLQVDPRQAAPAVARWLEASGIEFFWRTAASGFDIGVVHTSRGDLRAGTVFVTVNCDIDRLFPEPPERGGLQRCRLHMMRARMPLSGRLPAPLFTGWSLVRYSGFENLSATATLAARLRDEYPDYVDLDLHQMYTPQPDGSILLGDTHIHEITAEPFQSEEGFDVLIREAAAMFGVPDVTVTERWQGVYSSAPGSEFLIEEPIDGVHIVTVTTGIGMTTGLGLAKDRIDHVFGLA
ncbi:MULTISPECIES: TIGR03364 family FAD-dependent oxidoreductase [unclassified Rhodococcus (in: high G+C Gram-positive bacteria)]|uniref:TIGR03364 family FAD-dependent oxidoreductase n=1 Tax=unclassified Rhodococcus (in: high G+C Gram-positive bacteria) TaxID=192944 RepID=UPI00163A2FC8|nr:MULTISPECIES: TIGR03364 family FAD-dependent oxidoreductase [unclassified Rhodococcus (in: high G+C Gram-positive bacteria)]MBC2641007.1 TIGR03364 family FAD-dependent oxidoreductase [Rhodococcus sp. 3A]MBC2894248.1 TIGR03364 family FAD-dependent oxidoreductase [Rhodococcus sp. 4CII]